MTMHGVRPLVDQQALARFVDDGLSINQIAERFCVPYEVAHYNLRRLQSTADLAAQGGAVTQIAEACSVVRPTVEHQAEKNDIAVQKGRRGQKVGIRNLPRAEKMASMYRQGLTLEKIGQTFGITRERVRQLLARSGVTAQEGGGAKRARSNAEAKQARLDARYLAKYGLRSDAYKEARASGFVKAFRHQQNAAKARGVEWGLNLAQWLDVWTTSGKLELRGKGKGKYVMSRIKDTGGYVVGNVHIQLATENSLEAVDKWSGKTKTNRGVYHLYPGLARPYIAKVGRLSLGMFASEDEAVAARVSYAAANGLEFGRDGCLRPAKQPASA